MIKFMIGAFILFFAQSVFAWNCLDGIEKMFVEAHKHTMKDKDGALHHYISVVGANGGGKICVVKIHRVHRFKYQQCIASVSFAMACDNPKMKSATNITLTWKANDWRKTIRYHLSFKSK